VKANIVISTEKNDVLAEFMPNVRIGVLSDLDDSVDEVTPDLRIRELTVPKTDILVETISRDRNDLLVGVIPDFSIEGLAEVPKTELSGPDELPGSDKLYEYDELSGCEQSWSDELFVPEVRGLSQVTKTDALDEDALDCNVSNKKIANNLCEGMAEDTPDCWVGVEEMRWENEQSRTTSGSELSGTTSGSELSGTTSGSELSGTTSGSELSGTTSGSQLSGTTSGSELSGTTSGSELSGTTSGS
jgi:hypothetical protein